MYFYILPGNRNTSPNANSSGSVFGYFIVQHAGPSHLTGFLKQAIAYAYTRVALHISVG